MRILLVTGTFKPSINGVAISVETLAKNLILLGHKVLVLAPNNINDDKTHKYILKYPSIPNPFMPDYPIPLFPITPNIFEKVKRFKPQLIHVHHPFHIGYFASVISEQFKIPLVFTYHTKHDYYVSKYFKFLPKDIKSKVVVGSVIDFVKKCNLIVAPSQEVKKYLSKKGIDSITVIPSIVDDLQKSRIDKASIRTKLRLPQDKKILLFVGRLAIEKNIYLLINSLKYIPEDFYLVICGTGPLEKEVKEKIKTLKLKKRIKVVGKIERIDLNLYYQMSDYFMYPSKSETQGLIYWEALNFGLPIVSIESQVAREWVKDGFGLTSKNSPKSMAKTVMKISGLNYKKLSARALSFSKRFSSKKSALKMVSEYKKLI